MFHFTNGYFHLLLFLSCTTSNILKSDNKMVLQNVLSWNSSNNVRLNLCPVLWPWIRPLITRYKLYCIRENKNVKTNGLWVFYLESCYGFVFIFLARIRLTQFFLLHYVRLAFASIGMLLDTMHQAHILSSIVSGC